MKTLRDGTQVTSRSFYFLLDWNEKDSWKTLRNIINRNTLHDCNIEEYTTLFAVATDAELKDMLSTPPPTKP